MVPVGACAALVAMTHQTFDLGLAALIGKEWGGAAVVRVAWRFEFDVSNGRCSGGVVTIVWEDAWIGAVHFPKLIRLGRTWRQQDDVTHLKGTPVCSSPVTVPVL